MNRLFLFLREKFLINDWVSYMVENTSGYDSSAYTGTDVGSAYALNSSNKSATSSESLEEAKSAFKAAASVNIKSDSYDEILTDIYGFAHKIKKDPSKLRQGAMGEISKAYLLEGESVQEVCIKRFPKIAAEGVKKSEYDTALKLFSNEAKIACLYGSKGRFLATGLFRGEDSQGKPYLVMEYYKGEDLKKCIEEKKYLRDTGACKLVIRGILEALVELHDQVVYHRDLKPANIMVRDDNNKPVILDFGLAYAKSLKEKPLKTVGTFGYAPPEQQDGTRREITFASDIYSVGIIFIEMLTPDFQSSKDKIEEYIKRGIADLEKNNAGVFKDFILKCIKEKPEDRFQSADEALEEFICIAANGHNEFRKKCIIPFWDDGVLDEEERKELNEMRMANGVSKEEMVNDIAFAKKSYDSFVDDVRQALKESSKTLADLHNEAREISGQYIPLKDLNRIVEEQRKILLADSKLSDKEKRSVKSALKEPKNYKAYAMVAMLVLVLTVVLMNVFFMQEESPIPKDPMARNAMLLSTSEAGDAIYTSRLLKAGAFVNTQDSLGRTPLYNAVALGAMPTVDTILNHSPNVNLADKEGWTPLFKAAWQGNAAIVGRLIDHGADVGLVDKRNRSAIALALNNNHDKVVLTMLKRMSNADIQNQYDNLMSYAGSDASKQYLMDAKEKISQIKSAIEHDNVDKLKAALAYRSNADLNYADSTGKTWAHIAAANGSIKCIKYLASANVNMNAKDSLGQTPIFALVQNGSLDVAKALVAAGADIQVENSAGKTFFSLIKSRDLKKFVTDRMYADSLFVKIAMSGNQSEMERYMAEGAHIDAKDKKGNSAMAYAVQRGDLNTVKFLLSKGARVNDSYENGNALLHFAAKNGDINMMNELFAAKADCNAKNAVGQTPLMFAIKERKWNAVDLLLQNGVSVADVDKDMNNIMHYVAASGNVDLMKKMLPRVESNVYNKERKTPLHLAAAAGFLEGVQMLEKQGVSLNYKDAFGKKAVDYARVPQVKQFLYDNEHKNELIFNAVKRREYKKVDELLNLGAAVNVVDAQGVPLVHYAVMRDSMIMSLLLSKGADVNAVDSKKESALYKAVSAGTWDVFKCLMLRNPQLNETFDNGNTLLHVAVKYEDVKMFRELLSAHAEYNVKNGSGQTPLMLAIRGRNWKAVDLLMTQENVSVTDVDKDMNNLMHYAAASGNVELMKKLKSRVESNVYNKDRKTPLHLAAAAGSLEGVQLLESQGVLLSYKDAFGKKAVDYARVPQVRQFLYDNEHKNELIFDVVKRKNYKKVAELLSFGANVNAADAQGVPLVHYAVAQDSGIMSLLLSNGANVNAVDSKNETPLFKAIRIKSWDAVRCLMDHGASTTATNSNGEKLVHIAVATKDTSFVRWTLRYVSVNSVDNKNETPLYTATRANDYTMALFLLNNGADAKSVNAQNLTAMKVVNNRTSNYLDDVTFRNERFLTAMEKDDLKQASYYLSLGADVNAINVRNNLTALCEAVTSGATNRIKYLEKNGANLNLECNSRTPLGLAVEYNNKKVFDFLIGLRGVDATLKQSNGFTPLQMAVIKGNLPMASALINYGRLNEVDRDGKPALVSAIERNFTEIVRQLLDHGAHQGWRAPNGDAPIHIAARYASGDIARLLISNGANVEEKNNDGDDPLEIAKDCGNASAESVIDDAHSWSVWKWIKYISIAVLIIAAFVSCCIYKWLIAVYVVLIVLFVKFCAG